MTATELKTFIATKIDTTGRRLTTGVKAIAAFDELIDAIFSQFGQTYSATVNLPSNEDVVINIPSDYTGNIRSYIVWDSNGNDVTQRTMVTRGGTEGARTLTINAGKTTNNAQVNIIMQ